MTGAFLLLSFAVLAVFVSIFCLAAVFRRAKACGVPGRTAFLWAIWGPIGMFLFFRKYPLGVNGSGAQQGSGLAGRRSGIRSKKGIVVAVLAAVVIGGLSSASSGSGDGTGVLIFLGVLFFAVWFAVVAGLFTAGVGVLGVVVGAVQESVKKSNLRKQAIAARPVASTTAPSLGKDVLPPIARDIGARASGAYAMWVILVSTRFLDGTWAESDWLTHLISGNRSTGKFEKVALPFGGDVLREKFDFTVPEVLLLFELTSSYQKGYTGLVIEKARTSRASGKFENIDNFLEWFERAAQARPVVAVVESQREEIRTHTSQLKDVLSSRDPSVVHQVYVNATELTLTA